MGIFTGKTAIITGGGKAKSIGYGIATAYAKEGANLVLTGRNEQKLIDQRKNLKAVPAGRFGDPEQDIGRVCVHLGSPDFKYMSGETITLEGGLGQRP